MSDSEPVFDFLGLSGKTVLVMGVANKKSVAFRIAKILEQSGAEVIYSVRSEARNESLGKLLNGRRTIVCDVERQTEINALAKTLADDKVRLSGLVHSIAYADYPEGIRPFHETTRSQFLQAMDISAYSLTSICNALKDIFEPDASVVTIGISTTRMASESYGFMAPIKAALESSLAFLTKSFSRFSEVRFNSVAAGLLKTSASAGIPGYVDSYLYAEKVIPRGRAVETDEVASTAVFLLSPRSSGVTAQSIVVDAGMSINYFDAAIVGAVTAAEVD
ncbi:Enoyl-[acyl-carrier-protein] reductase [NADPH] FabI [Rubripirellula tenax]|uniref:Enoyl-[acyl-carrier-protein] reductase [NADH] n=1 Tax=Rubripirellula tenax TaxID=2528015 RepID=A0A5C6EF06_9BACT|nr:SDR family oxidoreductase [Rubripirellula tenax]TWU47428.1 Enoyl-[acyl-carrier-protein] reductase [NADPH] FabI [Rubripirellula tenax]